MDKINIKFNNPIMDQENIEKIAGKVNDVIDKTLDDNNKIEASNLNRKLYYHPIYMYMRPTSTGDNVLIGMLTILDNNPTAYNETTLVDKLKELMDNGAFINFNGGVRINFDTTKPLSQGMFMYKESGAYQIILIDATTNEVSGFELDFTYYMSVTDGVNEIYPNVEE